MERAITVTSASLKLPVVPNKLLNRDSEKMVESDTARRNAIIPLSIGLTLQDNCPEITTCKSQRIRAAPAKTSKSICLLNSRILVDNGRKNKGKRKTPTIISHLLILL